MGIIQMDTVVEKDGVINMKVSGLPFKKGQEVKVTFKVKEKSARTKGKSPTKYPFSSAGRLRNSPLIIDLVSRERWGISWRGRR